MYTRTTPLVLHTAVVAVLQPYRENAEQQLVTPLGIVTARFRYGRSSSNVP